MLLAATAARAFDFWADNADGKRLYYSYDGNSKVKVVNPDWDSFTQPSGVLRIPATVINGATTFSVTAIDTKAFEYCADITTVVIPEGVTSIGRMAFAYCTALDSVALPSTLTSIGTMAFTGTSFFSSSHLNDDGLLIAGNYLIGSRSSITGSIAVPDHVQGLGNMAFYSTHVERVTLPAGLRFIGENAFQDCMSLDTVELLGPIRRLLQPMPSPMSTAWLPTCHATAPGVTRRPLTGTASTSRRTAPTSKELQRLRQQHFRPSLLMAAWQLFAAKK